MITDLPLLKGSVHNLDPVAAVPHNRACCTDICAQFANTTIQFITYKIETRYTSLENNHPAYSSKSFGDMVTQPYTEHDFLVLLLC